MLIRHPTHTVILAARYRSSKVKMATVDARSDIVTWARWCASNQHLFDYAEIRPFGLYQPTPSHRIANDCSATFTLCYWLAGVIDDPTGFNYTGYGNTDSLVANGTEVASGELTHPGDGVIFYSGGATVHVALVIEPGADPLTMSHGDSTQPALVTVSQDGRSHKFFTFNTQKPAPPSPPTPTEETMNPVLTTNPNNDGTIVLDTALGTYKGLSSPAVEQYLETVCKIPKVPAPTKVVFAKFTQTGTI